MQLTFELYSISEIYRSFIWNKTTFTKYCLTQWISKFTKRFEIYWVRQYLVTFMCVAGIINATVYKSEPFFTGSGIAYQPNFKHCNHRACFEYTTSIHIYPEQET